MLFEKFCEVMRNLQNGTHQEFEKSRSEMSILCVEADSNKLLLTRQEVEDLQLSIAYTLSEKRDSSGSHFLGRLDTLWEKLQAYLESGLTPRALDGACTCAKNPIIKPVDGVCPVCKGAPRQ